MSNKVERVVTMRDSWTVEKWIGNLEQGGWEVVRTFDNEAEAIFHMNNFKLRLVQHAVVEYGAGEFG